MTDTIYIGKGGKQEGPYSREEVERQISAGQLSSSDLYWTRGMPEWRPLADLFPASEAVPPRQPESSLYQRPSPSEAHAGRNLGTPARTDSGPAVVGEWQGPDPSTTPSRLTRLGAAMIDSFLSAILLFPAYGVVIYSAEYGSVDDELMFFAGALFLIFLFFVLIQIILLSVRSQTVGKMLFGIKIVKTADLSDGGFVHAFLLRGFVPGMLGAVIPFFGLIDVLFIFNEEKRCLHDMIASTVVVWAKPQSVR